MKKKAKGLTEPDTAITTTDSVIASTSMASGKFILIGSCILFLFAFLLYANTINHDYVLDDAAVITKNKIVQQGVQGIPELLKTGFYYGYFGYNNNLYRPLPLITFAIGHSIWGNSPHSEHLINILLYALAGVLLFIVLIQISGKQSLFPAFLICLLFVAHPVHTEVVANIKSRDEILAFIFSIGSLFTATLFVRNKNWITLFFAGMCLFLGMISKESAIAFLMIIPLSIYFFTSPQQLLGAGSDNKNELKKRLLLVTGTALIAVSIYLFVRYLLFHNDPQTTSQVMSIDNVMSNQGFLDRIPTAIYVLGRYLLLLFVPHPLVYDYSFKELTILKWNNILVIISFLIYTTLIVFTVFQFNKKKPFAFGILFFLISIFIVSNILITFGAGMAERFLFTPSLGFCIAIGVLLFRVTSASENDIHDKKLIKRLFPIVIIVLGLYSVKTITRNTHWKNQLRLFSNDISNAGLSARAHYSLGTQLIEEGRTKEEIVKQEMFGRAESELKRALSLYPQYAEAILSLGNLYQEEGEFSKADEYLSRVSSNGIGASSGSRQQLLYNKANAMLGLKDYRGAIRYYQECIIEDPKMTESYINMGIAYKALNMPDSAIYFIAKGIEIDPGSSEGYLNLGTCYSAKNDTKNAILNFEKAIAINPKFAEAYIDLGDTYNRSNRMEEAEKAFKHAFELNPTIPEASFNLGYFYIKKENYNEAINYLIKASTLREGYLDALVNISFCASKLGRYQDVIDYAMKAIAVNPNLPDLYYNVAYGYDRLGNKALAMEYQMKGDKIKSGAK